VLKHVLLVLFCYRESVYVCLYFPICVCVRERERETYLCVLVDDKDVFLRNLNKTLSCLVQD
jgi:hypothetical protein